ncbi:MAG TPA: hypothetical protein DCW74_00900 [Alteromonas australica]|uniref:Phage tail assembly chaperone-like domain-containing protein n=1 Tax=Alteromonas australica TaxID=589873 RepID=A0A350NZ09_9ALTE|nr:hypothetical protein [Alteromonas australica]
MTRYSLVKGKKVPYTKEQEAARDAEEKAWENGQAGRDLEALREERNRLLANTDWWGMSDLTMTDAQKKYRQDLRDITKTATSLDDVKWPEMP